MRIPVLGADTRRYPVAADPVARMLSPTSALGRARPAALLADALEALPEPAGLQAEWLADVQKRERPSTIVRADPLCGRLLEHGAARVARGGVLDEELDRVGQ